MMTEIEWHEVTPENRPPENAKIFWWQYHRIAGEWSLTACEFGVRRGDNIYGHAYAPSLPTFVWTEDARENCRFFWAEIPPPHECGLIGPMWEPDKEYPK